MPLTYGSALDLDPAFFISGVKTPTKNKFFFLSFFAYCYLFESVFTSVFKDKKSKRNLKKQKNQVFLTFYLLMEGFGSGSVQIMTDPDPDKGGPKRYGSYGSESTTLPSALLPPGQLLNAVFMICCCV